MARENVRASDLEAGDRVLVDDHRGVWIVVARDGDPQFILNVAVIRELTQQTKTLHLFADQGLERML